MSLAIEQLKAMQLQVQQGYALIEHPRFVEAKTLLDALAEAEGIARLNQLVSELPDSGARASIANVGAAIDAVRSFLANEIPRVEAIIPAPPPPAPPAE